MDSKQCFVEIDRCGLIVVKITEGQAKFARAVCVSISGHLGLGIWQPAILTDSLLAARLKYLDLCTSADTQESLQTSDWQLGLGT